ncbi:hypothetical protein CASFOL_024037 [Castilleja foliolosa]|uniref:Uncharacterized protein n=1 Tax=Castilleja foliolosa TaxID=1961234 RepID=A0ABD3CN41_9LAMI
MAESFRLECRAGPMRRRVWWRKKMNKEDWLLDWEIMSTHWCKGTTSLCCPHLDERNGSTVCLLMELPYSSKVGKQLQPVFEFDKGLFSPQALSPVGTSLGSSRKVVLH